MSPFVPELKLASPFITGEVTVGDLLSHRSGLPAHGGDLLEDLGFSREQILPRLQFLPLDQFRISFNYSNIGYTFGPQMMAFPLSRWDGNLFVFETRGENAIGLSGAEFHMDGQPQATAVTLERYNKYGQGRFERLPSPPQL